MKAPAQFSINKSQNSPHAYGRMWLAVLVSIAMVAAMAGPAQAITRAALPGLWDDLGVSGARPNATRLSFFVSDQISATVDVGTGNVMVAVRSLVLPGINESVQIGATYNHRGPGSGSTSTLAANKWTLDLNSAGYISQGRDGVVYTRGDGSTWLFTPVTGSSTAFTPPAGLKTDLVKTGTGYTLTQRTSREVVKFDLDGKALSVADRNANTTSIAYGSGQPVSVTAPAGPVAARTATLAFSSPTRTLTVSQSSGGQSRSVQYVKDANSDLVSIVDANGQTTSFTYDGSGMTSITSPTGAVTEFTYGSDGLPFQVDQYNTTPGSPGTSTTRLEFGSGQTLVADPNADSGEIAYGPHTRYELDSNHLVVGVTDPEGRERSQTYTPNLDVSTSTDGVGVTSGTTAATYGANSAQSLTKVQAPGGANTQAAYTNTPAATKYLPSSSTDNAGNGSTYTYNGAGNMLTSRDATTATATLTYNTDGTVATALAPGSGTNKTLFSYTNHQLTGMTPVTGSTLGSRAYTYDAWGRMATATDGRGITSTYSYDNVDRLTGTTYSDSTSTVTHAYNAAGQAITRVDGFGTTTYGYDQLGRLISRLNTHGGGTIQYAYDRASNLTSTTDSRGTTSYAFDTSNIPTSLTYIYNGGPHVLAFATDDRGRRTDSWMDSNVDHTTWAAHTHTDYDTSGRVVGVTAEEGEGDADNTTVMDLTYCYAAGATSPTCPSTASADRSKLRWVKDNLTGAATTYTYDTAGRLTRAVVAGGPAPTTYVYTYDSRGNRLTASGGTIGAQTFTVNAANQITTTGYTYDGAGNLTADPGNSYSYNGAQQMTGVTIEDPSGDTTYHPEYAGTSQNEILAESTTGGYYKYTYGRTDQNGQPVIEQVKRDNATAYVEHDPVTGEPLMLRTSTGMQSLYVYDGTGNPSVLVTSTSYRAFAYTYDPYGVPTLTVDSGGNGTAQNPYTFKNGVQERTTGWIKYGARWYDPVTGRFTQQDSLNAPLDPANANRYAYAGGDPVNNVDPTGQAPNSCSVALLIVTTGVGVSWTAAGILAPTVAGAVVAGVAGTVFTVGLGVLSLYC